MAFVTALTSKLKRFNKRVDDYHEAITFSEAGALDLADSGQKTPCCETAGKNLVVASPESRFSEDIMDYALEMAKRMDYGIIAVNAANLTHDVTEFFSTTHDTIFQQFKELSEKNVEIFRTKALENGLKFAHSIQYSDMDHAIAAVSRECGNVEFVISENREPQPIRGSVQEEKRIAQRLCVYSLD